MVYNDRDVHTAKSELIEFWTKCSDAEAPLKAWFSIMRRGNFADFVSRI
jgi:mRNA-degrading endonuclease HigB of HigAB toxin-antitoxin module